MPLWLHPGSDSGVGAVTASAIGRIARRHVALIPGPGAGNHRRSITRTLCVAVELDLSPAGHTLSKDEMIGQGPVDLALHSSARRESASRARLSSALLASRAVRRSDASARARAHRRSPSSDAGGDVAQAAPPQGCWPARPCGALAPSGRHDRQTEDRAIAGGWLRGDSTGRQGRRGQCRCVKSGVFSGNGAGVTDRHADPDRMLDERLRSCDSGRRHPIRFSTYGSA